MSRPLFLGSFLQVTKKKGRKIVLNFTCNSYFYSIVLLQHGADPNIRNTDGKTALDVAEASAKLVLTGMGFSQSIFWFLC